MRATPGGEAALRRRLDALYRHYDHRFVDPDPLQFVRAHDRPADREVVGLVAAALAYGNVKQIKRSIAAALAVLGPRPARGAAPAGSARGAAARWRASSTASTTAATWPASSSSSARCWSAGDRWRPSSARAWTGGEHVGRRAGLVLRARPGARPRPASTAAAPLPRRRGRALLLPLAASTAAPASGSTCTCAGWCGAKAWTSACGAAWTPRRWSSRSTPTSSPWAAGWV